MTSLLKEARAVFFYEAQPKEFIACPVCQQENTSDPHRDRWGFRIGGSSCTQCGLWYLNPRMTAQAYTRFYANGTYRALVRLVPHRSLEQQQTLRRLYGELIAGMLRRQGWASLRRVLDVGGANGAVMSGIRQHLPLSPKAVTIIDPSLMSLRQAQKQGYQTIQGMAEALPVRGMFDGIICVATLDHLLNPLAMFQQCRQLGMGWLWIDFVQAQRKIDHPLFWTERSFRVACEKTGWQIQHTEKPIDKVHGFLCI